VKPTVGAEAILDARLRVIHAEGEARRPRARAQLVRTAGVRDEVRARRPDSARKPDGWPSLTEARWTLVDSYESDGKRYIIARGNEPHLPGLAALSERERQVVNYLALGQPTKETAYALGISDATVRVLLARAAGKPGVGSRAVLLAHPARARLRDEQP
jgi:DNA-binding CsgD family transcriptional regulator